MNPLYPVAVRLMGGGFRLAALFNPKARQWAQGRKNWYSRLSQQVHTLRPGRRVWFHVASVGEFEQARPVLEALRQQHPDVVVVLTFFSPSGYELRKNYDGAELVGYLPEDTPANVRAFLDLIGPVAVGWVKYEFWHGYLQELHRRRIPAVLFCAIFRPGQPFFNKNYGGFFRKSLRAFDQIFVQNESSARLLQAVEIQPVTVAGDTRFDRVLAVAAQPAGLPVIAAFAAGQPVLVVGSLWAADWAVLRPALEAPAVRATGLRVVAAPHEIHAEELARWTAGTALTCHRYSQGPPPPEASLLWIDNVGMLSRLYRYGTLAYVGGGFREGLHNILEAAVYGQPVLFGNRKYRAFQEAHDLLANGGAVAVADAADLERHLLALLTDEALRKDRAEAARRYVQAHAGATGQVMKWFDEKLIS